MKYLLSARKPEGFGVREKVLSPDRSRCWIAHQGDWRETHSEREMKSLTSSIEEYGSMSFENGCSEFDGAGAVGSGSEGKRSFHIICSVNIPSQSIASVSKVSWRDLTSSNS